MKSINFGIKCVKSEITDLGSIHEQFVLNYLHQNQAFTICGLLRRTLLNLSSKICFGYLPSLFSIICSSNYFLIIKLK